jgi:hypothetical protein
MNIELDDQLVKHAQDYAVIENRPVAKQIEHWAQIGRIVEDNPDLPYEFIRDALIAAAEIDAGKSEAYVRRKK